MAAKPPAGRKASGSRKPAKAAGEPSATSRRGPAASSRPPVEPPVPPPPDALDLETVHLPGSPGAAATPGRTPWQRHLRRYAPVYALALVAALVIVILPTSRRDPVTDTGSRNGTTTDGTAGDGGSVAGPGPGTGSTPATPGELPGIAIGKTRGDFDCRQGVRQLPWSQYAVQCQEEFEGSNGGATSRGVTADTITLGRRFFGETANSQAVAAFGAQAGVAAPEVTDEVREVFLEYFNETFELYGRKVVIEDLQANPSADATAEAQSRGKEGACIDATKAAQELKAYAMVSGSGPFSECAAERELVVMQGGAYFPETWYRQYDPYVWHTLMECERISYQVAEYVGKRLAGRPAKWAGSPLLAAQTRKFGTYVPNNDEYQACVDISEKALLDEYNVPIASRYNYTLDVSRFPDETARGVLQFKAAGVTTMIQAADPISTTFLTQSATSQAYQPEWLIIGVAGQDTDGIARLYDQKQVAGHLFGMSQLSEQHKLWGPRSEPGATYKRITGKDIPGGTTGDYYQLLQIFNFLQSAGPNLTPENMAAGVHKMMPGGAPDFAIGYVSYADGPDGTPGAGDHTGIDDSREVYWCGTCVSPVDGKPGTYIQTYDGKRFRNGEWPREEPPIYPG